MGGVRTNVLNIDEPFAFYLDRLRKGDGDAIFSLMDLGSEALPLIERTIVAETDASVRQNLVHVAWQTRVLAAIKILAASMNDPEPEVWKEAIDGLVCHATPEAIEVLRSARDERPDRPTHGQFSFVEWIDDALSQIQSSSHSR